MTEEYILEEDYPLMESINHYARLANKEDYKYKFIEIMKRIEHDDVVFLGLLDIVGKAFFVDAQINHGFLLLFLHQDMSTACIWIYQNALQFYRRIS